MGNRLCLRKNRKHSGTRSFIVLCIISLFAAGPATAQPPAKQVTAADFIIPPGIDSADGAVVLADIGGTDVTGNNAGSFSLRYQRYTRILITGTAGYDAATVSLPLYTSKNGKEELKDLVAIAYNKEGDIITETKLDAKRNVFTEKIDANHKLLKFALPGVKTGTVIEWKYSIISDFLFNPQPWEFQGKYPVQWSEYSFQVPSFFEYVSVPYGKQDYFISSSKDAIKSFRVEIPTDDVLLKDRTDAVTVSAGVATFRWVMKNLPGIKEEPYTSCVENFYSRLEFQLAAMSEPFPAKRVLNTWPQAAKELLSNESFGAMLGEDNSVFAETINKIITQQDGEQARIEKITAWVRNQLSCTKRSALLLSKPLSEVLRNKSGSAAEINMLLVKLLRTAGLSAEPVILSLRSHGYTHEQYPIMEKFNYVVCRTIPVSTPVYVDASAPEISFGHLPADCYNGQARLVDESGAAIPFSADSLLERKQTSIFAAFDSGAYRYSIQQTPGYYEAAEMRAKAAKEGEGVLRAAWEQGLEAGTRMVSFAATGLKSIDQPLVVKAACDQQPSADDILYIDPLFGQRIRQNPFRAAARTYPVEMPWREDNLLTAELDIPAGYKLEELPKPVLIRLNERNDISFEYRISESNGHISLRMQLLVNRTYFAPSDYNLLREFYNQVVKKQAELIVCKKK